MTPYQKISQASRETGLSTYFLRRGCRAGTVPHIRSGRVIMINVPALLEQLDRQSREEQPPTPTN